MKHPHSLNGKVALVTGGARGIGRAVGDAFIEAGALHVVYADILADRLAEMETSAERSTAVLDVTSEDDWQRTVAAVQETHGRLDVLVNNAGILVFNLLADTTADEFRRMMEINVTGVFLGIRTALPVMKGQGSGVIVNTSSSSGLLPNNFVGAYSASKWAVRGLTRAAALEAGPDGIRVCSIHPGGVNTPMTNPGEASQEDIDQSYQFVPLQRGCRPDEIANGVPIWRPMPLPIAPAPNWPSTAA